MSQSFPKRFYKTVATKPQENGHVVTLDGRVLKTPGKQPLLMASEKHASLIASEWNAQESEINPANMPLTRLMNVACERTAEKRDDLIFEAQRYGGTDLLCYRAESPRELSELQEAKWGPWLQWASTKGIVLKSTTGIVAIKQDNIAIRNIGEWVTSFDDLDLTLLLHFTAVYGSVILALAVMRAELDAGEAFDLSRLDALYQIERWGEDEEAAEIAEATRQEIVKIESLIRREI